MFAIVHREGIETWGIRYFVKRCPLASRSSWEDYIDAMYLQIVHRKSECAQLIVGDGETRQYAHGMQHPRPGGDEQTSVSAAGRDLLPVPVVLACWPRVVRRSGSRGRRPTGGSGLAAG